MGSYSSLAFQHNNVCTIINVQELIAIAKKGSYSASSRKLRSVLGVCPLMSTYKKMLLVHKEFSEFAPISLFGHLQTLGDLPLAKPHCRDVSDVPLFVSNIKTGGHL
jgi:hypothetical protein